MTAAELAREDVVQAPPDTPVGEVVRLMAERAVGSVVLVDSGAPVGMVTDRDVALRCVHPEWDPAMPVSELATTPVVTIDADAGIYDLVQTMAAHGVRRVPVIRDDELAGIVTLDDVLILLGMELNHVATLLRSEAPPFEVQSTEFYDEDSN